MLLGLQKPLRFGVSDAGQADVGEGRCGVDQVAEEREGVGWGVARAMPEDSETRRALFVRFLPGRC
jgi:hypothetical protein